jgi:hypothetical protein
MLLTCSGSCDLEGNCICSGEGTNVNEIVSDVTKTINKVAELLPFEKELQEEAATRCPTTQGDK